MLAAEYIFAGVVGLALAAAVLVVKVNEAPAISEPTQINDEGVCCTEVDGELVPADPVGLAKGRDVSPDAYALGRVVASEAGGQPFIGQVGVAWVVRNKAAAKGRSILRTITRATLHKGNDDGTGDGFFGRQGDRVGGYRFVASSKDASDDQLEVGRAVAAGDVDDPTEGAVNFDSPNAYGKQAGTEASGADEFAANREAEGKEAFALPGISINTLRFWRVA